MTLENIMLNPYDHENGYLMQGYVATELRNEGKMIDIKVKMDVIFKAQQYFKASRMSFYGLRLKYALEGRSNYISWKDKMEALLEDNEIK